MSVTYQERVESMVRKYQPCKLPNVPSFLQRHTGTEEAFLQALVTLWGPEPTLNEIQQHRALHPEGSTAGVYYSCSHSCIEDQNKSQVHVDANGVVHVKMILQPCLGEKSINTGESNNHQFPMPSLTNAQNLIPAHQQLVQQHHMTKQIDEQPTLPKIPDTTKLPETEVTTDLPATVQVSSNAGIEHQFQSSTVGTSTHIMSNRELVSNNPIPEGTVAPYANPVEGMSSHIQTSLHPQTAPLPPPLVVSTDESIARPSSTSLAEVGSLSSPNSFTRPPSVPAIRSRVLLYLTTYEPAKVSALDELMAAYAGSEITLLDDLRKRYGSLSPNASPYPSLYNIPSAQRSRSPLQCSPVAVASQPYIRRPSPTNSFCFPRSPTNRMLSRHQLTQDNLATLQSGSFRLPSPRRSPSPTSGASFRHIRTRIGDANRTLFREELVSFMNRYDSQNSWRIDSLMSTFQGREDELLARLIKRYDADNNYTLSPRNTSGSFTMMPNSSMNRTEDFRTRLIRMLETYDPSALPNVNNIMLQYFGNEELMMHKLCQKYGPEPFGAPMNRGLFAMH